MNAYRVRKKSTKVSPQRFIRMVLTKGWLDQNYNLLIKRPLERINLFIYLFIYFYANYILSMSF